MHTGENLNGSVFSVDSINDSIDTLANIPILAFVEKLMDKIIKILQDMKLIQIYLQMKMEQLK